MNNSRWDTRAWLLTLVSSLCALITANVGFGHVHQMIDRAFPTNLYGVSIDVLLTVMSAVVTLVVLPVALSLVARRQYLLWGLMPGLFACFWALVRDTLVHDKEQLKSDLWAWLVFPALSLTLTCGPASLFRFLRTRKRERLAALLPAPDAANESQEGVWPPPPTRPA